MTTLARFSEIAGIPEITDLQAGMDFRDPLVRREVFLRFYGFHLKYCAHPGAVYYVMPYLAEKYEWDFETRLWFAFINGATQNPLTSWVIFNHFPVFADITEEALEKWHWDNWRDLDYDIDRRYQKGHFVEMFANYRENLDGKTQVEFFTGICDSDDPRQNFRDLWTVVYKDFFMYGRLSTFSYLEYLKIVGLNIDCDSLFMFDTSGSKSHRNGLCKVLGRDDLYWHSSNPDFKGHDKPIMGWLEKEGDVLLEEAKERFKGAEFSGDVGYFTLESTLCCYKSWYKSRRYPNVYNDMFFDRIRKAEVRSWEDPVVTFEDFWEARRAYLPPELRREDCPNDPGLSKVKQSWYTKTGEVVMMDRDDPVFSNGFGAAMNTPDVLSMFGE